MPATVHTVDPVLRARLDRVSLGLSPVSELSGADGDVYADEEGTPIARLTGAALELLTPSTWPAPALVRIAGDGILAVDGEVPAGPLPTDVAVLLPSAAIRPDDARHQTWARAWSDGAATVVRVPWPPGDVDQQGVSSYLSGELVTVETVPQPPGSGVTVMLSGLSGSGKSTIARALVEALAPTRSVTLLDGDVVRTHLSRGLGFSREDRDVNIRRIGWVAAEVTKHGGVAVCAPIAPYDETRRWVRATVEAAGGPGSFVLVWVSTPLEVCEARDVKGLYARARAGEITGFTGIDDPYEVPDDAELIIDTSQIALDDAVEQILAALSSLPVSLLPR